MKHVKSRTILPIKRISMFILCFGLIMIIYLPVMAKEESNLITDDQGQIEENTKDIRAYFTKEKTEEVKKIFGDLEPDQIIKDALSGKITLTPTNIIKRSLIYLFQEIYVNLNLLLKLLAIIIICAIVTNLQHASMESQTGEVAFFACYIIFVSVLMISFYETMEIGKQAIDEMVGFMQAAIPVLLTLLATSGNLASGAFLKPLIIGTSEVMAMLIRSFLVPLIYFSAVLAIVDNLSDQIKISKLVQFMKQAGYFVLGALLTVFTAVISLQGAIGAAVDGVTSKTAKFAIGTFIPVTGRYLADAADIVVSCMLIVKNAAGILAMVVLFMICAVPLVKMVAVLFVIKAICAFSEPISQPRITNCLGEVAGSITFMLGVTASVVFMFFISIVAIIGAANISTMMR